MSNDAVLFFCFHSSASTTVNAKKDYIFAFEKLEMWLETTAARLMRKFSNI